jgi:hypothetical protein
MLAAIDFALLISAALDKAWLSLQNAAMVAKSLDGTMRAQDTAAFIMGDRFGRGAPVFAEVHPQQKHTKQSPIPSLRAIAWALLPTQSAYEAAVQEKSGASEDLLNVRR